MDRHEYIQAKRYQLELILIGFALACTGDRKKIIERVDAESLSSTRTRTWLRAIGDGDRDAIRGSADAMFGCDEGRTVLDALIDKIESLERSERISSLVADVMAANEFRDGALEQKLEAALDYVRSR